MEENLSKEILDKIAKKSGILYFPIRHHSPVCSIQVTKLIHEYKPDCILIEGPANCNELLKYFLDTEATYPLAIYYSYRDSEDEIYNCYYPMLEYSPELVSIRVGAENDIPVEFIDLSYAERLINTDDDVGVRKKAKKNTLSDDYLVSQSEFIHEIYTNYDCRNFDEFWEKIFEIDGLNLTPIEFIDRFNSYTYLLRQTYKNSELESDATIIREEFMAKKIQKATEKYSKILVVTGGFHTYGLIENLQKKYDNLDELSDSIEGESAYIMPFSMQECDAINGYASGMIFPAFYQEVWEKWAKTKVSPATVYNQTVFEYIMKVAKKSKEKNYQISLPDETNAYNMAINLAYLRSKTQAGKYECREGILSAFIKGEYSPATNLPIDILNDLLIGKTIGSITANFKTPPIVIDFNEKCKYYSLKISDSFPKKANLSVFSNEKHRQVSRFLTRLQFLDCHFASKISGGRFKKDINKKLIRETWEYKYTSTVISSLIERSIYGGTVLEAAYNMLISRIEQAENSVQCSSLLIEAFLMGINDTTTLLFDKIYTNIMSDSDFFNTAHTLKNLSELYTLNEFYHENIEIDYKQLIKICFDKCINSMIFVINVDEELEKQVVELLKLLYQLTIQNEFTSHLEIFTETLQELTKQKDINPLIEGAIFGILYANKVVDVDTITKHFDSYIHYTDDISRASKFLKGIFSSAREIIFVDTKFISIINDLISTLTFDEFILILPDLKLSFANFTPTQVDKIAKLVAEHNNISLHDFKHKVVVPEHEKIYGKELNQYLVHEMTEVYFFERE